MDSSHLQAWHDSLTASPKDSGSVVHCVTRPADGERALPESLELSVESAIEGDIWSLEEDPDCKAQVSLMNIHVARSVAASEEPERLALSGDNLLVDLDVGTENLPVGTTLEIGDVRLVITDQPHLPCKLFRGRFGDDAVTCIAWSVKEGHRGRGVMCRVQAGGTIRVGDSIRVSRV